MASRTRTKAQIESDRLDVARYYLEGKWQREIAELTGLSQVMVSYDLAAIQKQWRDVPQAELNELKAKELAKIDNLERTYWEAWENSKKSIKSTSTAKDGEKIKLGTRSQERNGNPQFLQGVERCVDRRIKLLGLDAPAKSEVNSNTAIAFNHDYSSTDPAELSRLYAATVRNPAAN